MNHRSMTIIFLIIILLIMPYYAGLKECIENPNYEADIADKYQYNELLTDYIILLKDTNQALNSGDDYSTNFNSLFRMMGQRNGAS